MTGGPGADEDGDAALISISALALDVGIAPATLRAWERRHGFPQPAGRVDGRRAYHPEQVEAVRRVVAQVTAGGRVADAVRAVRGESPPAARPATPVSPSELTALALAARGLSARDAGRAAALSPATVEVHRRNVIRKLGARNLTHAVALSFHRGLLAWSPGPGREQTELAELAAAAARARAPDDVEAARALLRRLLAGDPPGPDCHELLTRLRTHEAALAAE